MEAIAVLKKQFTVEEYIAFEEASEIRHEFHEGILYPIDGTSDVHNDIISNIMEVIRPVFRKRGCKAYSESVKLQIIEKGKYVYPDVLLTCDQRDEKSSFIKRFASLIIEVLSESTENYDRNGKFKYYQQVPSIQYYLMVVSRSQTAELFCRTDNPRIWTYQRFTEREELIEFPKLNFQITMEEIYQDLNLPKGLTYILGGLED